MLLAQINRSPDLKRLADEGFEIEVKGAHLFVHHIPYVNNSRDIKYGTLITSLLLNNDVTIKPDTHVMYFIGEHPCDKDGNIISGIYNSKPDQHIVEGILINYIFSSRPLNDYENYYHKVTQYEKIISAPAKSLDKTVTAQTFKVIKCNEVESIFHYIDSNSSRANINHLNEKFKGQRIGIVGLGGTGSYILDLVAKTEVDEILLFDADEFLQHNAFRAPGAASIDTLNKRMKKVDYFSDVYSQIRRGIKAYPENVTEKNIDLLKELSYVFICIDNNNAKGMIISNLKKFGVTFIDVGLGVNLVEDNLIGQLRVTVGTPEKNDHIPNRIGTASMEDDEYATNIQVADLNAMNALMAVMKWKKLCGFYQDLKKEHNSTFTINTGQLIHGDFTT